MNTKTFLLVLILSIFSVGYLKINQQVLTVELPKAPAEAIDTVSFDYEIVDPNIGGRTAIGDINGDQYNDIVVHTWGSKRGKVANGSVAWYQYPNWEKHLIRDQEHFFGDAIVIDDLNQDGYNDLIASQGNDQSAQVWLYVNPGSEVTTAWEAQYIGTVEEKSEVKDIELHDMDSDGKTDIVVRTKQKVAVYFQEDLASWFVKTINIRPREGMTIGDVDEDGDYDVVLNGFWLENPDNPRIDDWSEFVIDDLWFEDNTGRWKDYSVMAQMADINGDGKRNNVIFSHAEKVGFKITWYETNNPKGGKQAWNKHEIGVVDYCHSLLAGDLNQDGRTDIVAGTLIRSENPKMVVYLNQGEGASWQEKVFSEQSAYKAALGDIDNDGDLDVTSGLSWVEKPLQLWRNTLTSQ